MTPEKIHPHFHREERTDPITGHTLTDTTGRPWVQERECRVSLVNPSGGSCRRTDSLLGDSL